MTPKKGMSHFLLISLVIVSTFLCNLVNGEEEIKQAPAFADSEKTFKLAELLRKLQTEKQALDRERIIEEAIKDGTNLYQYLGDNVVSDSSDVPVVPPGYRLRLITAPQDPVRDDEWSEKEKKGTFMTLCHFKICNMGRKRWKSWP